MSAKKIILILFLLLLVAGGVFGYILYDSATKISAETSDFSATSHIDRIVKATQVSYEGAVVITANVTINNGGKINLKDLNVYLEIYFKADSDTEYKLVGKGNNPFGDVPANTVQSFTLEINVTENIALLAITDGTFKIDYTINVTASLIISKALEFTGTEYTDWQAPYSSMSP